MRYLPSVLCISLLCCSLSFGLDEQGDAIRAKLDAAKEAYEADIARHKAELLKTFAKREESLRLDGNKRAIEQLAAEVAAFEATGELQKSIAANTYTGRMNVSKKSMIDAYTTAIKEYVRARMDAEATAVEKQLEEFLQPMPRPKASTSDTRVRWMTQSGVGFEWTGEKSWREVRPPGKKPMKFTEVSRNGDYIDLLATDGHVYIRIHATVYYWGTLDDKNKVWQWAQWASPDEGTGSWQKP